jgi:hypothetical protein
MWMCLVVPVPSFVKKISFLPSWGPTVTVHDKDAIEIGSDAQDRPGLLMMLTEALCRTGASGNSSSATISYSHPSS